MKNLQQVNQYLADLSVWNVKLHNLHFNVTGPQFKSIHEYLESIYDETKEQSISMENLKIHSKEIENIFRDIFMGVDEVNQTMFETSKSINSLIKVSEILVDNSEKVNQSVEKFIFL